MWQSTQICKTKWHGTPFCSFLVSMLVPSKRSRFIAMLIRFARQQRDFTLQTTWILSLWSSLQHTFLISCLQGSFCLGLSSSSGISQNSIRFHHKDHERHIYSPYCSVCYWSGSLGKEFSGGGYSRCQYICQHQLSQPSFNHTLLSQMIKNPSKISWEKLLDIYVEAVQENPYNAGCIAHSCA